jgi:hypothetical protein
MSARRWPRGASMFRPLARRRCEPDAVRVSDAVPVISSFGRVCGPGPVRPPRARRCSGS